MSRPAIRSAVPGVVSALAAVVVLRLLLLPARLRRDRGDIPGWVLITVMTAGVITAIWFLAEPALTQMFTDALNKVKGP